MSYSTDDKTAKTQKKALGTPFLEAKPAASEFLSTNKKIRLEAKDGDLATTNPHSWRLQLPDVYQIIIDTIQITDLARIVWGYYFDIKDFRTKIDTAVMANNQAEAKYYCALFNELLQIKAQENEDPYVVFMHQPWRRFGKNIFLDVEESKSLAITEYYDDTAEECFYLTDFAQSGIVRRLIAKDIVNINAFSEELLTGVKRKQVINTCDAKIKADAAQLRRLNSYALGKLMLKREVTWEQANKITDQELYALELKELQAEDLLSEMEIKNITPEQLTTFQTYGVRKLIAANQLTKDAAILLTPTGRDNLALLNTRKLIFAGLLSVATAAQLKWDECFSSYCWRFQSPRIYRLILHGRLSVTEIIQTKILSIFNYFNNAVVYHDLMAGTLTVDEVKKFEFWQTLTMYNFNRIIWPYIVDGNLPPEAVWRLCLRDQDGTSYLDDREFVNDATWNLSGWFENFILFDEDVFRLVQNKAISLLELMTYKDDCGEQIRFLAKNQMIINLLQARQIKIVDIFNMLNNIVRDNLTQENQVLWLAKLAASRVSHSISFFTPPTAASSNNPISREAVVDHKAITPKPN